MAKITKPKAKEAKEETQIQQILDNPDVLQEQVFGKTQEFADKNKNIISIILGVFVLAVAAVIFYRYQLDKKSIVAEEQLFPAIFLLEKDSTDLALNGDGNFTEGIKSVSEEYSSTDAGNLAAFYAGIAYMKKGEFDNAIASLNDFSSSDLLLQGRAYSLLGDAYMEKKDLGNAISYYKKASDYKPNDQITPAYLVKLGLANELAGKWADAATAYQQIVDKFPKSAEVIEAKKLQSRAATMAKASK